MKQIPNLITSINLACGFIAIVSFAYTDYRLKYIPVLILICLIADFLDGLSARILNAGSKIGEQLDSFADLVSFGVVPGLIAYYFLAKGVGEIEAISHIPSYALLPIAAIIPIFTAWRLAKFNLEGSDFDHFRGLPSPANAIFYVGLIYADLTIFDFLVNPQLLMFLIVVFSILMVSNTPMFNLKFKSFAWKGNEAKYLFLLTATIILVIFQLEGISLCIIAYIFASLINNWINK